MGDVRVINPAETDLLLRETMKRLSDAEERIEKMDAALRFLTKTTFALIRKVEDLQ